MRVLFWNTHNNQSINKYLLELIIEHNVSCIVLAEYNASKIELLNALLGYGITFQELSRLGNKRITIFGSEERLSPGLQTDYSSFITIDKKDILCCVHLPSNIYKESDNSRGIIIKQIIVDIEKTEKEQKTNNTIIVGDFNMNPFDNGCLDATEFHGMPYYEIAQKGKRTIAGKDFYMFYNPMWSFLVDNQRPHGTYYYSGNDTRNTFWKIYDQVLIRPSLKKRFVDSSLRIITETKSSYLLNRYGHPDKMISDHLPILFEIQEDNDGKQN